MIINFANLGGGGGGGYVLPVASESTLGGVKIGSGISIDSGGTISAEGGSGSPTIVNLDALSQSELVELYNTLSGETSASTVNEDYIFLKSFTQVHGDNKVPFKVQYLGLYAHKTRFYVPRGSTGHNGEIWNLYTEIDSNGVIENGMQANYSYLGTRNADFQDTFVYNVDTGVFSVGATTFDSGTTYSGVFDKGQFNNILNGTTDGLNNQMVRSFYKLNVTGSTVDETYSCPILSKKAVAQVTIEGRTFNTRFCFDYGEYVLSFLVSESDYKARPEIKYRANVVQISQSDYDALVAGGTVDPKTIYVII